ncbi:MAG: hypothetical protein OXU20_01315 [Myxococcales bacterium]|nr:hypothetical protein [Myxococcales bacterium]MDD9972250.1 hypothetical protein [Myxococcales bacterium]
MAWLVVGLVPSVVAANEFDEFQKARSAYEVASYELSAKLFGALVGGEVPRLQNRSLVLESLKYLGASLLFMGETGRAENTFERLLRMEIDYVLDPLAFPQEVQVAFARVKGRLQSALVEKRQAEQEREQAREAAVVHERERARARQARLLKLASTTRIEEQRSRLVAMVPFGAGQFQNGDKELGFLLAASQVVALGVSITGYVLYEQLRAEARLASPLDNTSLEENESKEDLYRNTNRISMVVFAALAIAGVVDAQLRFQPTRVTERPRNIDPELRKTPPLEVGLDGIRVRF